MKGFFEWFKSGSKMTEVGRLENEGESSEFANPAVLHTGGTEFPVCAAVAGEGCVRLAPEFPVLWRPHGLCAWALQDPFAEAFKLAPAARV